MDAGIYPIELAGEWSLRDFYEFQHAFLQVYAFQYSFWTDAEVRDRERLIHAFSSYPWRGGYSAVNFYGCTQQPTSAEDLAKSQVNLLFLAWRHGAHTLCGCGLIRGQSGKSVRRIGWKAQRA